MALAQDKAGDAAASSSSEETVDVVEVTDPRVLLDVPQSTTTTGPSDPSALRAVHRPGLRHMLWYVLGGSLPERHWTWVLHDTTCRTWALRQLGRPLLILAPVAAAYIVFVPGPLGLRLITGLTWSGGIMLYMFVNMLVDNDRRAVRAGYVSGYVEDVRSHRSDESHHLAVVARNARAAQRRARRNA